MSLSYEDLQAIRKIVEETISPIKGDLEALGNDIKEIYNMITDLQKDTKGKESSQKLSIEEKILSLHSDLVEAARQAGVTLPSH
jgi:uncharacterized Fe-S cluster-containing radical SAM superfamily enzyme